MCKHDVSPFGFDLLPFSFRPKTSELSLSIRRFQRAFCELNSSKVDNTITSTTVNFTNIGNVEFYSLYKIIFFNFEKTVLYNISSGTKVMTLPANLIPRETFRAVITDSASNTYILQFTNNGGVYTTKAITANTVIAGDIVYITE